MLVASAVLGLFAVAAPAAITVEVSHVGDYTVVYDTLTVDVNVYDVILHGHNAKIDAIDFLVGLDPNSQNTKGVDPFNYGWMRREKIGGVWKWTTHNAPTEDDEMMAPGDGTYVYESDTRFLPAGIGSWSPAVSLPAEGINKDLYDEGNVDYGLFAGQTWLAAIVGVPVSEQAWDITIARVGILATSDPKNNEDPCDWVYARDRSSDGTSHDSIFPIPEPATLMILGLGALGLIRRRR